MSDDVQRLDFIPEEYRIQREKRHSRLCRQAALGVFLILMLLGWFHQFRTQSQLTRRRDHLQLQAKNLSTGLADPLQLQKNVTKLDQEATLTLMLQLHPSPSRLLETIAAKRPQFVSLTELQLQRESVSLQGSHPKTSSSPTKSSSQDAKPAEKDPVARDLDALRSKLESTALVIHVHGLAPDHLAVSDFLGSLQTSGLFSEARLLTNGQRELRGQKLQSFEIQLTVRSAFRTSPQEIRNAGLPGPSRGAVQDEAVADMQRWRVAP